MGIRPKERRRFPRIDHHAPVRSQIKGGSEYSHGIRDDLSVGGLCYICDNFIPPATQLVLEINIFCRVLKVLGKVVWANQFPHSDRNRHGIEFMEMDQFDKKFLTDYISMYLGQL